MDNSGYNGCYWGGVVWIEKERFIYRITTILVGDITMATVVTRNYQITLSKEIREEADIKIGERMRERIEDDKIILEKIKESPVEAAAGIWAGKIKDSVNFVNKIRNNWR